MEKLYTPKEVSEELGSSLVRIREVEDVFDLGVFRTSGNRKYYTEETVRQIKTILEMRASGAPDSQIKGALAPARIETFAEILDSVSAEEEDAEEESALPVSYFEDPPDQFYSQEPPKLPESIGMQIEAMSLSMQDLLALVKAVSLLKDEMASLKHVISDKEKEALTEENAQLKAKVKEKTYEIVELREQLKMKADKRDKKGFFSKL
ncbi:MAG: helix-turn-helix domain-containing protein [Eubacteriaceae bacterium]|jgi:DNA-binding transcriptional MerR regulator|nr:helix-turn-helix domain-containing protein [Eubacteriaceae bacterium]